MNLGKCAEIKGGADADNRPFVVWLSLISDIQKGGGVHKTKTDLRSVDKTPALHRFLHVFHTCDMTRLRETDEQRDMRVVLSNCLYLEPNPTGRQ